MINVLALYPAFDVRMNEMAIVWRRLCATYPVHCNVLAHSYDGDKALNSDQQTEEFDRLKVRRFPALNLKTPVLQAGLKDRPDVIFCAVRENFRLARRMQRLTGAPIVLHIEFFLDDSVFLDRRYYLGFPPARPLMSSLWRAHLRKHANVILASNPQEFVGVEAQRFPYLRYLPWPHPPGTRPRPDVPRDIHRGAYIGSIRWWKGAATLLEYFTRLLETMPDFSVDIVGPTMDDVACKGLADITRRFGNRVRHRTHLEREDARDLMAQVLFVLSPGRQFGWGQIGDSWLSGTPVIAVNEHYDLRPGVNCLIARDASEFVRAVAALQHDEALRAKLIEGGSESAAAHSPDAVASALYAGLLQAHQAQ